MLNWYKTAKETNHEYSWVYIELPKTVTKKLLEFGKEIDPDDLYVKEAENGLEKEPHVTVKYGLTTEDTQEVKKCIDNSTPGKVHLGKSSIFEQEEYDVVKVTVESKILNEIHEKLNRLPHEDKYIEYSPHATIAYVKKGMGKKYNGKFNVNETFSIQEVYFGDKSRKNHKIKLGDK